MNIAVTSIANVRGAGAANASRTALPAQGWYTDVLQTGEQRDAAGQLFGGGRRAGR